MYRVLASFALVFVVTLTPSTFAQQGTSEIGGRVADEQGAVLPGVSIVLTNEDSGVFREVTGGEDGSYFASALTPGVTDLRQSSPDSGTLSAVACCSRSGKR